MRKIIFGRVPSFEEAIDLFVKPYQNKPEEQCPLCGQAKKTCEECLNPTVQEWIEKEVKNG